MATGVPERYRRLDALREAAVYVDGQGDILAANEPFHDMWFLSGAESGPIEGRTLLGVFAADDRESVRDTLEKLDGRARPSSRVARLAGSLTTTTAEFVPIRRQSRGDLVWLVTLRSSRRTEDSFDDEAFRSAVTAGVVHDLRAPLQVVLGWTSLLKRTHDDPARIQHALSIVERNSKLQMALLDHLLEILRPSWTRPPLRHHHVDLEELVDAEVRAVQPLAEARGVRLTLRADAPGIAVDGSEVHLRRVVANLVGNALKFTPPGGTVECRLGRLALWASLVVRDSGQGIDRQFLPSVFDAFRQEPRQRMQNGDGLGLGLSVVRHLVELHGGTVTAASAGTGCGATFTVMLPAVPRLAVAAEAPCACSL